MTVGAFRSSFVSQDLKLETHTTTGVASFLPLFFYCFFLYIYSDTELLPNAVSLPRKLGRVASLLLLILIPAIVGFNEVASFVGIERRELLSCLVVITALNISTQAWIRETTARLSSASALRRTGL